MRESLIESDYWWIEDYYNFIIIVVNQLSRMVTLDAIIRRIDWGPKRVDENVCCGGVDRPFGDCWFLDNDKIEFDKCIESVVQNIDKEK